MCASVLLYVFMCLCLCVERGSNWVRLREFVYECAVQVLHTNGLRLARARFDSVLPWSGWESVKAEKARPERYSLFST